jgi:hypothetical protein
MMQLPALLLDTNSTPLGGCAGHGPAPWSPDSAAATNNLCVERLIGDWVNNNHDRLVGGGMTFPHTQFFTAQFTSAVEDKRFDATLVIYLTSPEGSGSDVVSCRFAVSVYTDQNRSSSAPLIKLQVPLRNDDDTRVTKTRLQELLEFDSLETAWWTSLSKKFRN